ncbi:uncharacterized protein LOC123872305 [Maniola jurtina]|uniref:uncharacterized protein LOC123872305 n=1 Tax=Maniola jurtina TaxID=191418 RepID=UPI001E6866D5|nr:uncharacterized protein LOC123872305 [Maniola jurtina]
MCSCSKCTYCMGNIIYICERLASCFAATSVVTCIVATLLVMLALGIGLGYNYCFVDLKTGRYKDDNRDLFATLTPVDSTTTGKSDSVETHPTRESITPLPVKIAPTMVVPLFGGIDFSVLIQKIKQKKQNYTMHLMV